MTDVQRKEQIEARLVAEALRLSAEIDEREERINEIFAQRQAMW